MMAVPSLPVGVIGCGNMGTALARGILGNAQLAGIFPLMVFDRHAEKMEGLITAGAIQAESLRDLALKNAYIILAVKPDQVFSVLQEIKSVMNKEKVLLSLAVGLSIAALDNYAERSCPLSLVMPNTLVEVGQGLFGVCLDDPDLSEDQKQVIRFLFSRLGKVSELPEYKMNAFAALAGCGPAYVFYVAEALVEAGVYMGLDRNTSRGITFSLLQGSAALAEKSEKHLTALRDEVTSPGGTTITATTKFDELAVRGGIIQGVLEAFKKGQSM